MCLKETYSETESTELLPMWKQRSSNIATGCEEGEIAVWGENQ
jgi:hypothetical protein